MIVTRACPASAEPLRFYGYESDHDTGETYRLYERNGRYYRMPLA